MLVMQIDTLRGSIMIVCASFAWGRVSQHRSLAQLRYATENVCKSTYMHFISIEIELAYQPLYVDGEISDTLFAEISSDLGVGLFHTHSNDGSGDILFRPDQYGSHMMALVPADRTLADAVPDSLTLNLINVASQLKWPSSYFIHSSEDICLRLLPGVVLT